MCTVVVRVPDRPGPGPVRLLAVRDEDPARPWRDLGSWWPDRPGVIGVRDELAGGAWLAADGTRLSVLLNRDGTPDVPVPTTRGALTLDAVAGLPLPDPLTTLGFNLVEADVERVRVSSWTGQGRPRVTGLAPGTHMLAHDDVDDPRTPRVAAWLAEFAAAPTDGDDDRWWRGWFEVVRRSTSLGLTDDRSIIRDNRAFGFPTLSLLIAIATIDADGVRVRSARLDEPGLWNDPDWKVAQ